MVIVQLLYALFFGLPMAVILWTLAFVCAVTIVGLPLAAVLATFAVKVLTLKRRPAVVVRGYR